MGTLRKLSLDYDFRGNGKKPWIKNIFQQIWSSYEKQKQVMSMQRHEILGQSQSGVKS
jgi:ubiquinone/menaquinone biosynthesis C-methylase UbiE